MYLSSKNKTIRNLLTLFLCTDGAFIAIHLVHTHTRFAKDGDFSLEQDRGYGEVFQYVKLYWISILLMWTFLRSKQVAYFLWSLVFGYLLIDDACQIHETAGGMLAHRFGFIPMFNLRAQDFGELTVAILAGTTIFFLIGIAHLLGSDEVRMASTCLIWMLGVLMFFGVVIDMAHIMLSSLRGSSLLTVLEDGGEMLTVSLTCYNVFIIKKHAGINPAS